MFRGGGGGGGCDFSIQKYVSPHAATPHVAMTKHHVIWSERIQGFCTRKANMRRILFGVYAEIMYTQVYLFPAEPGYRYPILNMLPTETCS